MATIDLSGETDAQKRAAAGLAAFTDNPNMHASSVNSSVLNGVASTARASLEKGVEEMRNFVEQNPSSVRAWCFCVAVLEALYCSLGIFNLFALSFTPVEYIVNLYVCLFALITVALEGKSDWPVVSWVQEKIFHQAHFLSTVHGRACFYIFHGTLGMGRMKDDMLMFIFGLSFTGVGILILIQTWKKSRQVTNNGDDQPVAILTYPSKYEPRDHLLRDTMPA